MTRGGRRRAVLVGAVGVAVLLALGLVVTWHADDWRADRTHDAALARWEAREPAAYSFTYSGCSGMCALCRMRVFVVHGEVRQVVATPSGCGRAAEAPTVEDVFAREALDRHQDSTDSFAITYDPHWGFPASVEIRCPAGWSDCGSGYSVADFRAGS